MNFFKLLCTKYMSHIPCFIYCSVESHEEGRAIVFDDSRNHRAFCYGEDERIVLILDLERPDSLPKGTATGKLECQRFGSAKGVCKLTFQCTGGHTEELDEFIQQLT